MKQTLLVLALATAGAITVPTLSHAADAGFFVNGALGRSDLNSGPIDDSDIGYYANVGYRWAAAPSALIGIEGGYAGLGTFKFEPALGFNPAKLETKSWTLGANGHFNVAPQWYLSARGGYARSKLSGDYTWVRRSVTSNGWYAGAGFGYDFSNNMSMGLNYDHYKVKSNIGINLLSAGAEVRF